LVGCYGKLVRVMSRVSGHFGEFLQGRIGARGPVALITIPCPVLGVTASYLGDGPFSICGPLSTERAANFLSSLGHTGQGRWEIVSEMIPGGGAGVSSASLLALAKAMDVKASPEDLAKACKKAEGAVDPLMFKNPEACLWASRQARQIRCFSTAPELLIIGGFWGRPSETIASDIGFSDISDLIEAWAAAKNATEFARLATISAERCTALRGPVFDPTADIAKAVGALGWVRAHTGSARGLIFASDAMPREDAFQALTVNGYLNVISFQTTAND
jgi:uncharacterized protein involved in propanediol utilization